MVWSDAVVTVAGISLLKESILGRTLRIVSAAGGTGTVPAAALMAQTALAAQKQTLAFVDAADTPNGKRLKIQITNQGLEEGYTLNQVGIWAALEEDEPVLFALLQDTRGVDIPATAELPEFLLEFYAVLEFSQYADIEIQLDPAASVSMATLNEKLAHKEGSLAAAPEQETVADTDCIVLTGSEGTRRIAFDAFRAELGCNYELATLEHGLGCYPAAAVFGALQYGSGMGGAGDGPAGGSAMKQLPVRAVWVDADTITLYTTKEAARPGVEKQLQGSGAEWVVTYAGDGLSSLYIILNDRQSGGALVPLATGN